MHIGLIGGIGPAATVAYYERLSPTFSGGAHALTVVQADMETLVANAVAQDAAAQAETYLPLLRGWNAQGRRLPPSRRSPGISASMNSARSAPCPLPASLRPSTQFWQSVSLHGSVYWARAVSWPLAFTVG